MAELRSKKKKEEVQRPTERLKSFTERSEEELIKSLMDKIISNNEEDTEESEYYEGVKEYHKKTNGL
jgi:hypothetical protein